MRPETNDNYEEDQECMPEMAVGKSLSLTKTPIPQLPSPTTISAQSSHQQQQQGRSGVPPAVTVLKKGPAIKRVKRMGSGDDSYVVVLD